MAQQNSTSSTGSPAMNEDMDMDSGQTASASSGKSPARRGKSNGSGSAMDETTASRIEGYLDRQLQVVADDLENFAAMLGDALDSSEPGFRQTFRSTVEPLSDRIAGLADLLREQDARRLVEKSRRTVVDHPVAVVGGLAALAAGLAQIAVIAARRSDRGGSESGRSLNA